MKHYLIIQNKKYSYSLSPAGKNSTIVRCDAARISQEFLNKDIPGLLRDLPKLIIAEKDYKKDEEKIIQFRVSAEDKKKIEEKAFSKGFPSVSSFLRYLALDPMRD